MYKFLLTLLFLTLPNIVNAATPKEFTENLADKVVNVIASDKSDPDKEKQLIELFKNNVDTDWMAKFTMGKYFRGITEDQKKKYLGLYHDYVAYAYIPKFRTYAGEKIVVNQVIEDDKDLYTVKTTLQTEKSSTGSVLVDYKLKKTAETYKIIDIIGEGVSLITTQRSDFSTPLSEQGVDKFLERLESKVADLKAHPDTTIGGKKKGDTANKDSK